MTSQHYAAMAAAQSELERLALRVEAGQLSLAAALKQAALSGSRLEREDLRLAGVKLPEA